MIDLHTHTNLSDGSCTPAALLEEARQIGLTALAITDHDTLAGYDDALAADGYALELVCGTEVSTLFDGAPAPGASMHVLGYFPGGPPDAGFRAWLSAISSTRRDRNLQLMKKLQSANISISWDDFPDLGPDRTARPHLARVLVEKGYAFDYQSAFDRYLNDVALAGVERRLPSTQEAIGRIRGSGGIASLAHPFRIRSDQALSLTEVIEELVRSGLDAVEVYHSDHSPKDSELLRETAARFGLLLTGGSDYHGDNKPDIRLGSGRSGNICLSDELLRKMKERVR